MSKKQREPNINDDLGLGNKLTGNYKRLMHKGGKPMVQRVGEQAFHPYQVLVEMSWGKFILSIFVFYLVINALFGLLYVALGNHTLSGIEVHGFKDSFLKAFFFSIQTFTTVGYGAVAPACWTSNVIASIEALFGLMIFALATGLFYARFARPQKSVRFSQNAVIAPYHGHTGLMFRFVNIGNNELIELKIQVSLTFLEKENGVTHRKYMTLKLERDQVALFPFNWTVVHPIDEESPLYGKTEADCKQMNLEIMAFLRGYDATSGQLMHKNESYSYEDFIWNAKFVSMYHADKEKGTVLELNKLHDVERLSA